MSRWIGCLALATGSCVPSNVVAPADREVKLDVRTAVWEPARCEQIEGLFASDEITGAAAGPVLKLFYYFESGGSFTGAALMQAGERPEFQVLSGSWTFADGKLVLGAGAEPATLDAAPGLLRLRGDEGGVVLRRIELR